VAPLLAPYLALRGYGCLQKSAPPPASRAGRLDLRSCVAADASIGNGYRLHGRAVDFCRAFPHCA
jgi:hypothetical protein